MMYRIISILHSSKWRPRSQVTNTWWGFKDNPPFGDRLYYLQLTLTQKDRITKIMRIATKRLLCSKQHAQYFTHAPLGDGKLQAVFIRYF